MIFMHTGNFVDTPLKTSVYKQMYLISFHVHLLISDLSILLQIRSILLACLSTLALILKYQSDMYPPKGFQVILLWDFK